MQDIELLAQVLQRRASAGEVTSKTVSKTSRHMTSSLRQLAPRVSRAWPLGSPAVGAKVPGRGQLSEIVLAIGPLKRRCSRLRVCS